MEKIRALLRQAALQSPAPKGLFYKTGPGYYAAHDRFMGVNVPTLRNIAKMFPDLSLEELETLLKSKMNEERFLALVILVNQYQKASTLQKEVLYQFYRDNLRHVNNWNLVDASAHLILGVHLEGKDKSVLSSLAKSKILWERRIAVVATWHFIRKGDLRWTFEMATLLLKDPHDLIHKAVGWMLREAGKRDEKQLMEFLDQYGKTMPRTMLRYAIEKFSEHRRKHYLLSQN